MLLLDRKPFEINLQKTESGPKKTCTRVQVLWAVGIAAAATQQPGGVRARALELEFRLAVSSADWFAREHTRMSCATSRSVSPYAPAFPSWNWASRPSCHVRRLSLWNTQVGARYTRSGYLIATIIRHVLTLQSRIPAGILPQLAAADQGQGRGSL